MIENLQKTLQNFVSFKCLKNKKINLSPAILKLETLLYQNTYIYYFILYYFRRAVLIQKKSGLREKNMPYFFTVHLTKS